MIPITQKGYDNLIKKIEKLKQEFNSIPLVIAKARAKGDLKENAEYHAAREKQGMLNAQIEKISNDIQNSKIIDPKTLPPKIINFGKKITLTNLENNQDETYVIMGPHDCEGIENALSITSELAKKIITKKENEEVLVPLPKQSKRYKIKNIEYF